MKKFNFLFIIFFVFTVSALAQQKTATYLKTPESIYTFRFYDKDLNNYAALKKRLGFPSFEFIQEVWDQHIEENADATFFDDVIDGCGFEIIKLDALKRSHEKGSEKHRSELCTLYLRENSGDFKLQKVFTPLGLNRQDLRLTVDNPEDLVLCKAVYENFLGMAPRIPIRAIVEFLDLNPSLIALTRKFTDEGYKSMYKWNTHE